MPRRRFLVARDQIQNRTVILPPDQAHHLRYVLRLSAGDEVELIDGEGNGYVGNVEVRGAKIRIVDLERLAHTDAPSPSLTLAPALIKSDRFEWILQKATELGVLEIIPLRTRFCKIHLPESRIADRLERWQRIVGEAAKQCRRLSLPQIRPAMSFPEFLKLENLPACNRLMFYEKAAETWSSQSLRAGSTVLCIGPEGGWDASEVEAAERAAFKMINLGPRILRAETAAIAGITLIQFRSGISAQPHSKLLQD